MIERNVSHPTFVIERVVPHATARVFRALVDTLFAADGAVMPVEKC